MGKGADLLRRQAGVNHTMDTRQSRTLQERAARGKYKRLFMTMLVRSGGDEWRTTFENIEGLLRFTLPASARRHPAWWANEKDGGGKSQKLAWTAAGWKTAEVDMEAETVVFKRPKPARAPKVKRAKIDLDKEFHVHHAELLQKDATFSREEIYEDRA